MVGSYALKNIYTDFTREPKDIDFIIGEEVYKDRLTKYIGDKKAEYLYCPPMFDHLTKFGVTDHGLLTLKASHIFWNINWDKHMYDICFLIDKGAQIIPKLFYDLYAFWNDHHGKNKRSDLKMSASEFFSNAVKCPHDHDWLHTLINPYPTFNKVLVDGAEVEVSEQKFNSLTYEEKLDLVREEIYVMAYERLNCRDYRAAYYWMLKKFIISHAPIWEALFIIENFRQLDRPLFNYVNKINDEIQRSLQHAN